LDYLAYFKQILLKSPIYAKILLFYMSKPIRKNREKLPFNIKTLTGLSFLILVWFVASSVILPKNSLIASDLTIENILVAINQERSIRNLTTLKTDLRLSIAAQYKSNDMQNRHYFSHTDPEGNYIWNKIVESGYSPYLQLGENLAIEFNNTESLVSAWMNSPTHRANVLHDAFNDQGMGLAFGNPAFGQYYSAITNTFGSLLPQKKPASPPSPSSAPAPNPEPAQTQVKSAEPEIIPQAAKPDITKTETPLQKPPETPSVPVNRHSDKLQIEQPRSSAGSNEPLKVAQNFSLPPKTQEPAKEGPILNQEGVISTEAPYGLTAYQINRYGMLAIGVVLLFMVISDLKKMFEEKFHAYDKKINNLVLLILSLIVVGLMYWL